MFIWNEGTDTVLAAPCEGPLILSEKESKKVLDAIRNKKPLSDEEKMLRKERVKALFPGRKVDVAQIKFAPGQ